MSNMNDHVRYTLEQRVLSLDGSIEGLRLDIDWAKSQLVSYEASYEEAFSVRQQIKEALGGDGLG